MLGPRCRITSTRSSADDTSLSNNKHSTLAYYCNDFCSVCRHLGVNCRFVCTEVVKRNNQIPLKQTLKTKTKHESRITTECISQVHSSNFLNQNLCCDHSLELSRRDDSTKCSQHRIRSRSKQLSQKQLNEQILISSPGEFSENSDLHHCSCGPIKGNQDSHLIYTCSSSFAKDNNTSCACSRLNLNTIHETCIICCQSQSYKHKHVTLKRHSDSAAISDNEIQEIHCACGSRGGPSPRDYFVSKHGFSFYRRFLYHTLFCILRHDIHMFIYKCRNTRKLCLC